MSNVLSWPGVAKCEEDAILNGKHRILIARRESQIWIAITKVAVPTHAIACPPLGACSRSSMMMMIPPACVLPMPIGFALCPIRGIVFAAARFATACLPCIVAPVHGLGVPCGFQERPLTPIVFKTDRLRTPLRHLSKTQLDGISDMEHDSYIHFVHRTFYASLCLLPR